MPDDTDAGTAAAGSVASAAPVLALEDGSVGDGYEDAPEEPEEVAELYSQDRQPDPDFDEEAFWPLIPSQSQWRQSQARVCRSLR